MTESGTTAAGQNLAALKIPELRKIAAEQGLKGLSGLRKGELIQAISTGVVPRKGAENAPAAGGREGAEPAGSEGASVPRRRAARRSAAPAAEQAPGQDAPAEQPQQARDNRETRDAQEPNEAATMKSGKAEGGADGEEQRYESRSAARRARRNRARQGNDNAHDASGAQHGEDKQGGQDRQDRQDRNDKQARNDQQDKQAGQEEQQGRGNRDNRDNGRGHRDERNDGEGGNRRGRRNRRNRNRGRDNRDNRDNNHEGGNGGHNGNNQDFDPADLQEVAGIVDVVDNNTAFIRTTGYRQNAADVFVNNKLVRSNGLRSGDAVIGQVRANGQSHSHGNGRNRQRYNQLVRVDSVNGMSPGEAKQRKEFHKLTPLYPNKRLRLETEPNILTTRVIDLVMPIGKGQRALIVSPPKAGKTTILQNIANAIATNNPECYLMVVLVDERPEEVTDMQRSVKGEVIASTFDRPPSEHTAVAELAIERAKRLVEMGQDVVVLLDSITRLGRAYNNSSPASGRILSGGVDSNALYPPKRFLGAARNIEEGGSLTIIATAMVETGSAGDTVIFEEFKGTGNAELKLDRKIAERRVFPAVDVNPSGTRKDELLMSPEEARIMHKLRRILSALDPQQSIDMLIKQLKKTKSNGEFLMGVAQSAPMAASQDEEEYS
ncbi:transcription termination factor Rho [Corynebacterium senegalense]|uniref:transcription termination factor Rho n=1 Tax=Corynebacterium senegalense TaxID=2080750 RepID=UPI000E1FD736|nr:transcription termination factor Rho [Corynebacterium senegalense]